VIAAEQTAQENLSREIADQIITRVATRLRDKTLGTAPVAVPAAPAPPLRQPPRHRPIGHRA
jgi:LPS-assembly lipoprotein